MNPVLENGLQVICGDCYEPQRWEGKGRKAVKVCGCDPVAGKPATEQDQQLKPGRKKCSKRNTKAKGDGFEREVAKAAESWGYVANRTAGSGAFGSRTNEQAFATDVRMKLGDKVWRIECKRHASVSGLKSLLKLKDNSEILVVREDFQPAYVVMTLEVFGEFAALAAEKGAK